MNVNKVFEQNNQWQDPDCLERRESLFLTGTVSIRNNSGRKVVACPGPLVDRPDSSKERSGFNNGLEGMSSFEERQSDLRWDGRR